MAEASDRISPPVVHFLDLEAPRRLVAIWLSFRLPAFFFGAFLLKDWIIARQDDPETITLLVIELGSTPVARTLFFLAFIAILAALFALTNQFVFRHSYWAFLLLTAITTLGVLQLTNTPPRAKVLCMIILVLPLAGNLLPDSHFQRLLPTAVRRRAFAIGAVGISEFLFLARHISATAQYWTGKPIVVAGVFVSALPAVVLASAVAAVFVRSPKLVDLEQTLRMSPAARIVARGDFNWIEIDAAKSYLLVSGQGLGRIRRYDLSNLAEPPMESPVDTGNAQGFAYDPAAREIYVANIRTRHIVYLDAASLELKRSIATPELAFGDPWMAVDPRTNTITVASEYDLKVGTPFLVLDRASGAVRDKRDFDPGYILLRGNSSQLYLSFFRRRSRIVAFDLSTLSIMGEAPVPPHVDRMLFMERTNELLLTVPIESRVIRLDADTLQPKGHISANFGVRVLAIDEQRNIMFAGSLVTGQVAAIDLASGRTIRSFYLGPWLRTIQVDAVSGVAYVSSRGALYELRYGHLR